MIQKTRDLWELPEVTTVANAVRQEGRVHRLRHRRNLRQLPQRIGEGRKLLNQPVPQQQRADQPDHRDDGL
jgi:hypothetical protein